MIALITDLWHINQDFIILCQGEIKALFISRQLLSWHPSDVIAALKKMGTSLAALSRAAGLSSSTLANALTRSWPKGEFLIGEALRIHPSEIWPSRYFDREGKMIDRQKRIRGKRGHFPATLKNDHVV